MKYIFLCPDTNKEEKRKKKERKRKEKNIGLHDQPDLTHFLRTCQSVKMAPSRLKTRLPSYHTTAKIDL